MNVTMKVDGTMADDGTMLNDGTRVDDGTMVEDGTMVVDETMVVLLLWMMMILVVVPRRGEHGAIMARMLVWGALVGMARMLAWGAVGTGLSCDLTCRMLAFEARAALVSLKEGDGTM